MTKPRSPRKRPEPPPPDPLQGISDGQLFEWSREQQLIAIYMSHNGTSETVVRETFGCDQWEARAMLRPIREAAQRTAAAEQELAELLLDTLFLVKPSQT
jgi:hypothetical protein